MKVNLFCKLTNYLCEGYEPKRDYTTRTYIKTTAKFLTEWKEIVALNPIQCIQKLYKHSLSKQYYFPPDFKIKVACVKPNDYLIQISSGGNTMQISTGIRVNEETPWA